ncbi:hypothetical protein [Rhodococcus qingshengii]|uniref:hypothetical protein n=1 Tax=Rhodococcus qingshengii TaxID=334542 RepID=UPI0035DE6C0E
MKLEDVFTAMWDLEQSIIGAHASAQFGETSDMRLRGERDTKRFRAQLYARMG